MLLHIPFHSLRIETPHDLQSNLTLSQKASFIAWNLYINEVYVTPKHTLLESWVIKNKKQFKSRVGKYKVLTFNLLSFGGCFAIHTQGSGYGTRGYLDMEPE